MKTARLPPPCLSLSLSLSILWALLLFARSIPASQIVGFANEQGVTKDHSRDDKQSRTHTRHTHRHAAPPPSFFPSTVVARSPTYTSSLTVVSMTPRNLQHIVTHVWNKSTTKRMQQFINKRVWIVISFFASQKTKI